MGRVVRIPVRVARASEPVFPVARDSTQDSAVHDAKSSPAVDGALPVRPSGPVRLGPDLTASQGKSVVEDVDWRDRALRLQAEMENYRKRQQRLAEDQMRAERERLVRGWLPVVDGLERAMARPSGGEDNLLAGIGLIHRTALHILREEGVERFEATGLPFDPAWHEAVATAAHDGPGAVPGTVLSVVQAGYRAGDRLIRPARVVVAS